ncbi:MAG TPA: biopolymer transporter ExbD [Segetibacter sp.]|jgi:biopolymer transport protein ExbD
MAEVTSIENQQKKRVGVAKSKKLSTRVDLTPMVDLGFLLLTFFIFTTTMSQPTAVKIVLPDDSGESTRVKQSGALTILLGSNSSVYYYEGELQQGGTNIRTSSMSLIRETLISKKRSTTEERDFVVIIKPATTSVYKDLVNIVDEMTINDVKRYALVDITLREEEMLRN